MKNDEIFNESTESGTPINNRTVSKERCHINSGRHKDVPEMRYYDARNEARNENDEWYENDDG